jgi:hypothetical protein
MSHLSLETIARLVDDAPDATEKSHLDSCTICRSELENMRADLAALASLPGIEPSPEAWSSVESRLAQEGLLRLPRTRITWQVAVLRAAAAVVIFLLGGMAGIAWVGGETHQTVADSEQRGQIVPAQSGNLAPYPSEFSVRQPMPANGRAVEGSLAAALISGRMPSTRDGAVRFLTEAEAVYLDALTRMAQLNGGTEPSDPYARLAALEIIAVATREALDQAPADPVLNGYHITALANREALLRQVATKQTRAGWF